jgi:hypothetical protein
MPKPPAPITLLALAVLALPAAARAQADDQSPAAQALGGNSAPGGVGAPGGSSGFGHRGGRGTGQNTRSAPGEMPELKPLVEPRQRLDPGALLCHTEAQLRQHQAAIMARLQGRTAPEPAGCHIIGETIAVAVLQRDGQALTQVQLAGDTPQAGWTDSVVRDADPLHSLSR